MYKTFTAWRVHHASCITRASARHLDWKRPEACCSSSTKATAQS